MNGLVPDKCRSDISCQHGETGCTLTLTLALALTLTLFTSRPSRLSQMTRVKSTEPPDFEDGMSKKKKKKNTSSSGTGRQSAGERRESWSQPAWWLVSKFGSTRKTLSYPRCFFLSLFSLFFFFFSSFLFFWAWLDRVQMRDDDHEIMVKTRGSLISVLSDLDEDLKSLPAYTHTGKLLILCIE